MPPLARCFIMDKIPTLYAIYFQELLLEHADLFYHFKSIAPSGTITQDDIKEITDALLDDFRYIQLLI